MKQPSLPRPDLSRLLCCSLATIAGLLLLTGCQSDFAGSKWFPFKNPFSSSPASAPPRAAVSSHEAVPPHDVAKNAGTEREQRKVPVVRTEVRPPERDAIAAAHDIGKREIVKPDSSPEFAQEMIRAKNLERSGKAHEARIVYERLITRYPDRYEPFHRLGVIADRGRRFGEAQALFDEAIRRNPTNPDLHNDLGYCLYLQGQFDQAEAAVTHALRLNPANPRYYNNLGMIYGHQRRYEEALAQFRRGGSEADAYYNLAFMLAAREDTEGAKKYFHLALQADPGYDQARQALAAIDRSGADGAVATVNNGTAPQRDLDPKPSPAGRYETQPTSLTMPMTPALGGPAPGGPAFRGDLRDPALIR